MFIVGELADKSIAKDIGLYLNKQGIEAEVKKHDLKELYAIFIIDESQFEKASDIFRVRTGGPRTFEAPKEWSKIQTLKPGLLTRPVIALCVAIYLAQNFANLEVYKLLKFSSSKDLFEIKGMQLWRVFTPCLIHFGFMHIFFNLMWWKDLSKIIEKRFGVFFLVVFCIVVGSFSNYSQFLIGGPGFGGLSGVVFALFGLNWMMSRFEQGYEYSLPKSDIFMMVGWFIFCLTGALSMSIANMAHATGLSLGMLIGLAITFKKSNEKKQIFGFSVLAFAFIFLGQF